MPKIPKNKRDWWKDLPGFRDSESSEDNPVLDLLNALPHLPVPVPNSGQPLSKYHDGLRAIARVLMTLQHDSPERQALLASSGIPPEAVSPELCTAIAAEYVNYADDVQAEFSRCTRAWKGIPHPSRGKHAETSERAESGLRTRNLAGVKGENVSYLWHLRIPQSKLTILSGDPGVGKTFVVLDVIARITTGRGFEDGAPNAFNGDPRNVLWVSAEDDDDDTVVPRLLKMGADTSRVDSLGVVVEDVKSRWESKGKKEQPTSETRESTLDLDRHLQMLDRWLTEHPLVVLVVLDPIAAFFGSKIDTHRNSDIRRVLTPLKILAAKHKVAIVGINHLNKGGADSNAIYRNMGSLGLVAAARSSWMVSRDPKQPGRRLLTWVKGNLGPEDVGGLAFTLDSERGVLWEKGKVDQTADDALRSLTNDNEPVRRAPALSDVKDYLQAALKDGPILSSKLTADCKAMGFCTATVSKARQELGIEWKRIGGRNGQVWTGYPHQLNNPPKGLES